MKQTELPITMKAVLLPAYNQNVIRAMVGLKVNDIAIPAIQRKQVLVKMEAATCNPSDVAFIRGVYGIKKNLPAIPGFEGCGIVVAADNHPAAEMLIGKRVSCLATSDGYGTWAEYLVTDYSNCIEINKNIPTNQAACMFVNPLTSLALMDIVKKSGRKSLIINAAASKVGQMIRSLAKKEDITIINIVRREEQAEKLMNEHEKYVIISTDEDFDNKLKSMAAETNALMAFDAVGGEMTGKILNAMPESGKIVVYGGLSGEPIGGISTLEIIYKKKIVYGFNLMDWLKTTETSAFKHITDDLQTLMESGEIKTEVQGQFNFTDVIAGMKQYLGNMSAGKIIFCP